MYPRRRGERVTANAAVPHSSTLPATIGGERYPLTETLQSATCTLIVAHPEVEKQRPFCQPLYGRVPVEKSRQSGVDLSRIDRNSACAVEADGPQPTLGGRWACTAAEARAELPCLFNEQGEVLVSSMVGRIGRGAPQRHPTPPAGVDGSETTRLDEAHRAACLAMMQSARAPHMCPEPRSGHVLVPLPSRNSLLLHGGLGEHSLNDTWEYDIPSHTWKRLTCRPVTMEAYLSMRTDRNVGGCTPSPDASRAVSEESSPNSCFVDGAFVEGTPCVHGAALMSPTTATPLSARGSSAESYGSAAEADEGESEPDDATTLPTAGFGQAACVLHPRQFPGEEHVAVYGGINDASKLSGSLRIFRPQTATWTLVRTSQVLPPVWGAVMETMTIRRPETAGTALDAAERDEEQVVVIFGGMMQNSEFPQVTRIVHLEHPLTREALNEQPEVYLGHDFVTKAEREFVVDRIRAERRALEDKIAAQHQQSLPCKTPDALDEHLLNGAPPLAVRNGSNSQDCVGAMRADRTAQLEALMSSVDSTINLTQAHVTACTFDPLDGSDRLEEYPVTAWKRTHRAELAAWRRDFVEPFVGTFWVENVPNHPDLHGRRRACGSVYKDKFFFVFGGRDGGSFYNDFWVFNVETRLWVPIREEIPLLWLQRFFASPHDRTPGEQLQLIYALVARQLRGEIAARTLPSFKAAREEHLALFASEANATAAPRTGGSMVFDRHRQCLYLYGGFAISGGKYETFHDLHTYSLREHRWRRVNVLHQRNWDSHLDGAEDAVLPISPLDEARTYPRFTALPQARANTWRTFLDSSATTTATPAVPSACMSEGTWRSDAAETSGVTIVNYLQRLLMASQGLHESATSPASAHTPRMIGSGSMLACKRPRRSRADARAPMSSSSLTGASQPADAANAAESVQVAAEELFLLPTMAPEPRTMGAMVMDPTAASGGRLFLHGGRSEDDPLGDMFIISINAFTPVDQAFHGIQKRITAKASFSYSEAAETQRRLRCGVSDGILRTASLTETARTQSDGESIPPCAAMSASSVHAQAHLWLRGLLEAPVFLKALTAPHLADAHAPDAMTYMGPTKRTAAEDAPTAASVSRQRPWSTDFATTLLTEVQTLRSSEPEEARTFIKDVPAPKATAAQYAWLWESGAATCRASEALVSQLTTVLGKASCAKHTTLATGAAPTSLPAPADGKPPAVSNESTAFNAHRVAYVLFGKRQYWRKSSLHQKMPGHPITQ